MGPPVFQIFGAPAEYERSLKSERTKAGLRAARARGRKGGRRRKFGDAQVKRAAELLRAGQLTVDEICATMRIGALRSTATPRPKATSARSRGRDDQPREFRTPFVQLLQEDVAVGTPRRVHDQQVEVGTRLELATRCTATYESKEVIRVPRRKHPNPVIHCACNRLGSL